MKALFLDVDGCLNNHDYCEERKSTTIHRDKVDRLNHALRMTGASIVLSSAWRYLIHRGEMKLQGMEWLLRSHGLIADKLYSITRPDTMMPKEYDGKREEWPVENERGQQIADWITDLNTGQLWMEEKVTRYVVVDDMDLGITDAGHPFVHVDGAVGLTDADVKRIIFILNKVDPPKCMGRGPTRRCGSLVHPGYTRCPTCDLPYPPAALLLAKEIQNANTSSAKADEGVPPAPELHQRDTPGPVG